MWGAARGLLWGLLFIPIVNADDGHIQQIIPSTTNENNTLHSASPQSRIQKRRGIPTAPYPRGWTGAPSRYPARRAGLALHGLPLDAPINFRSLGYEGPIAPDQRFKPRHQYAPPMNPWYGLPVPTAMGPYAQRRPVHPQQPRPQGPLGPQGPLRPQGPLGPQGPFGPQVPLDQQGPLSPLRDFDPTEKRHDNVKGPQPWQAHDHDTWQGAQDPGHVVRPPSPDVLASLVPPHMRVRGRPGARTPPQSEEVGYVDEPSPEQPEPERRPKHHKKPIARMPRMPVTTAKPNRVFLWRPPPTIRLPALLGSDDAMPGQVPSDDEVLLSEEEAPRMSRRRRREAGGRPRAAPYFSNSLLL